MPNCFLNLHRLTKCASTFFASRIFVIFWLGFALFITNQYATGIDFNLLHESLLNGTNGSVGTDADFAEWRNLLESAKKQPVAGQLKLVNDFFNHKVKFESDAQIWNKNDYWATPMQTLSMKRGDCEDYSIAKYFTLAAAGVSEDKLRLMYVQALQYNQAHMVLAYYPSPEAEPLVLDNLNHEILPASARPDLKPVYSLARRDTESHKEVQDVSARMREAMRQTRMSVWQELIKRAQKEGFD